MKQLWFAMSLMAGSLFFSANASADVSSGALLQQMNLASQSLNYELAFISINKQGVESLRYRHARLDNQPLAQLLQMDGPRREVVQRGNEISYFEPGLEPFTLNGDYIVDSLPSLIYTDFKRLAPYYDFIFGRAYAHCGQTVRSDPRCRPGWNALQLYRLDGRGNQTAAACRSARSRR